MVHTYLFSVVLNILHGLYNSASMHSIEKQLSRNPSDGAVSVLSPPIKGHAVNDGCQSLGGNMSWAVLLIHFLELSKRVCLNIYQISSKEYINAITSVIVCCSKDYMFRPFTFL